jgi:hypothetical protein
MAEINWTLLTYVVVGVFALNGFYRGWWKEAITATFLTILVFLLQQPAFAEVAVGLVNGVLEVIWTLIPNALALTLSDLISDVFAVQTNGDPLQIDPSNGGTWLLILIVFMGLATLMSRSSLGPYRVTPMGSILGGLVGAFNGFVAISLIREYLREVNLPRTLTSEIASSRSGGIASSGVGFQAVNVPDVSILDSFLPWIIIVAGVLLFLMAINNRVGLSQKDGFRKVDYRRPLGYKESK